MPAAAEWIEQGFQRFESGDMKQALACFTKAVEVELPLSRFVLDGKLKQKPRWTLHATGAKLTLK